MIIFLYLIVFDIKKTVADLAMSISDERESNQNDS